MRIQALMQNCFSVYFSSLIFGKQKGEEEERSQAKRVSVCSWERAFVRVCVWGDAKKQGFFLFAC